MRRLFATDISAPLAAATCVLVFLLSFLCLGSTGRYLASHELASQTDVLVRRLQEAVAGTRHELEQLPPIKELNCRDDGTSEVLAERAFQNPYVRWIGVKREGEMVCRSGVMNRDPGSAGHLRRINNVWSIQLVQGTADIIYVKQHRDDAEYIAIPETMIFEFESLIDCTQCVGYEWEVFRPDFIVRAGNWDGVVIRHTQDAKIEGIATRITLGASQRYVDKFQSVGRIVAAGIAAIVALALSFILYGLLARQTSLESLMRQGLRRGEFLPYYQPIVDGRDGSVLGAEALVRWYRRGKLVPPGQFVPSAEENGLIGPITDQLVKKVLEDVKAFGWVGTNRYVSINAEPDQIVKTDFCASLVNQLKVSGIPGKNIAVEITERHQLTDLAAGRSRLLCLAEAGVDIKIDDAGTGFGGFSYVQELPVSTLKIDKIFVDTLRTESDAKRPVLDAIIQFARQSGLSTVAEGVETSEQVEYLTNAGVYAIQGYVYSRPMTAEALIIWVKEHEIETPGKVEGSR
jgi:EAL domain-containing protein (putative c-di-GMP-specific phosphodiesterase class I)